MINLGEYMTPLREAVYETEVKVELSWQDFRRVREMCLTGRFVNKGTFIQNDFYVKAVKSECGGPHAFDIERYRAEGEKFFYTKKVWEVLSGADPIRREEEHQLTQGEFNTELEKYSQDSVLRISKERDLFRTLFAGREISLSIDTVKFAHSAKVRYFIEAEILLVDKTLVPQTNELLRRFVSLLINMETSALVEAPGMFALAFNKL